MCSTPLSHRLVADGDLIRCLEYVMFYASYLKEAEEVFSALNLV